MYTSIALLRLRVDLEASSKQMSDSYMKLSNQLTELKMDHNSGKNKSNELTQFLVHIGFGGDSMVNYGFLKLYNLWNFPEL